MDLFVGLNDVQSASDAEAEAREMYSGQRFPLRTVKLEVIQVKRLTAK